MKRVSDRFSARALDCTSFDELHVLVADASQELGFDHFAILQHASLSDRSGTYFRLDNYPEGWSLEFVAKGHSTRDPVHIASRRVNTGFAWNELASLFPMDDAHRAILEGGRRHGLADGFTIPANVPGEPAASCSFVVRKGNALPTSRHKCAELVGAYALRAARQIHRGPVRGPPHLSKRERECLRLVALGKSDWEAAAILGISVETARQYVKRARAAYDVTTRTQLVVCGLRDGWISFEDALPLSLAP